MNNLRQDERMAWRVFLVCAALMIFLVIMTKRCMLDHKPARIGKVEIFADADEVAKRQQDGLRTLAEIKAAWPTNIVRFLGYHPDIATNVVNQLLQNGTVCKVRGEHDLRPTYYAIDNPPRRCAMCGVETYPPRQQPVDWDLSTLPYYYDQGLPYWSNCRTISNHEQRNTNLRMERGIARRDEPSKP